MNLVPPQHGAWGFDLDLDPDTDLDPDLLMAKYHANYSLFPPIRRERLRKAVPPDPNTTAVQ